MKLAVSSYSFERMIAQGELTQLGVISKAKELGFQGVEFAGIEPHDGSSIEEYAIALRGEAERVGIPIINFSFGADFLNTCDGGIQAEIERVKKMIDIAQILGVSCIRHDATRGIQPENGQFKSFASVLPTLVLGCRAVTEYAKTKGIRTMVENHGFFCQDSERVEMLVNGVDHENFGWLVDIGNFLCVDENPITAVGRAAPYAAHVHVKDFHVKSGGEMYPGEGFFRSRGGNYLRGAIVGQGDVPVVQCLGILKQQGYEGYVSIEFEGLEDNITALRIGIDNLRRFVLQT